MTTRKSIFITGGASGIGRAVAEYFAGREWQVGLGDVNEAGMKETLGLLAGEGHSAHRLDVTDRAGWASTLAAFAATSGGKIDVVFNNAGIAGGGPLMDHSDGDIDRLVAINFVGVVNGARAAYPWLKAAAPGSCLLNTASAAALYGSGGLSVYSATKFAVRAMTEALETEWAEDGIKVRSIMPSFIDTPLLQSRANANTNQTPREGVIKAGLEFTPVLTVAQCCWDAVHGQRLHTIVGKTARKIAFAAKWMPNQMRERSRKLMAARED